MHEAVERVHGGVLEAEAKAHGVDPRRVIDFSVNLNPYCPCEPVAHAARTAPLDAYPDPSGLGARQAWARALDRSASSIAVANGAADLIWAAARAFCRAGERVVICEPTFSEPRIAFAASGARLECIRASERAGFRFDLERLAAAGRGAHVLALCSPNNPTGEHVAHSAIEALARELPSTLVLLDQSFLSLSDHADELPRGLPSNVLCLRSLTKDFALPGLRIAYAVGAPEVIATLERARPTWSTSAPALAAIERAAQCADFVRTSWVRIRRDRERLRAGLVALGLAPLPSSTSFQLVDVGDASRVRHQCYARGVLVRDASSFGLPRHIRLAARPMADTAKLLDVLASVLRAR